MQICTGSWATISTLIKHFISWTNSCKMSSNHYKNTDCYKFPHCTSSSQSLVISLVSCQTKVTFKS